MAKEKQYVFSARTTEEGLRQLNEVKNRLKLSWDDLVIDAVCEKYGLEKETMALPRKEKPAEEAQATEQQAQSSDGKEKTKKKSKKG
jgi:hypothetical protein